MRCLIAGGGTGGHLFPGMAVAEALVALRADAEIRFACTPKGLDRTLLEPTGWSFEICEAPHFPRSLSALVRTPVALARAGRAAWSIVRRFRPDVVVGCGGHGAFAPAVAAMAHGIPVALLEQNVIPGRTTRLLARRADVVYGQWEATARTWSATARYVVVGNPLRRVFHSRPDRAASRAAYGLDPDAPVLLVFGGSQGARGLNRWVSDGVRTLGDRLPRFGLLHLCGRGEREALAPVYAELTARVPGFRAQVIEFETEMPRAYAAADLVVARAGGTGIAEMTAFGLPMVLVPYPLATDHHQAANAAAAMEAGAAVALEESTCDAARLAGIVPGLLMNPARLAEMSRCSLALGRPQAGDMIAAGIEELAMRGMEGDPFC